MAEEPAGAGPVRSAMETLRKVFDELVHVRVVTAVGKVNLTLESSRTRIDVDQAGIEAIVANFDLTDGDITNVLSPGLRDDTDLMAFHTAQLEKALTVLPDNIRMLIELGRTITRGLND